MSSLFRELQDADKIRRGIEERQRERYATYGLLRNPFPLGGNFPAGYLEYTYLGGRQKADIQDFLASTFERSEFNGLLVLGEYGTGKSHLLSYIAELVNVDKLGLFGGYALAFLIENPSVAPEDIVVSLLRKIRLGTIQDLVFLPIRRELQSRYGDNLLEFLDDLTSFTRQTGITQGILEGQAYRPPWYSNLFSISYQEFRKALKQQHVDLKSKVMRQFAQDVILRDVTDNVIIAGSLVDLILDDETRDASSWESFLLGSLSQKRGQIVGVEFYLGAFLRLFEIMGIRHIYLLVDELEDLRTQRLSKKAATEYLATLRRMIQHNYQKFSFVLASTRDAWEELKILYPAIEDRFKTVVDLVRGPEEVKQVVARYLEQARPKESTRASSPEADPWFPFCEAAIDLLIERRGIVLRHVITECRRLIDLGLDGEVPPPLTRQFIEQNLISPTSLTPPRS